VVKICYFCGKEIEDIEFRCSYCNLIFCSEHRLPEKHNCVGLRERSWNAFRANQTISHIGPRYIDPKTGIKKSTKKYVVIGIIVTFILLTYGYFYVTELKSQIESLENNIIKFWDRIWLGEGGTLKNFDSVGELIKFLKDDNTNKKSFSPPDYISKHFGNTLVQRAKEKGYRSKTLTLSGKSLRQYFVDSFNYGLLWPSQLWEALKGESHVVCLAVIDGEEIVIEPQTDAVFRRTEGRYYSLLYKGES